MHPTARRPGNNQGNQRGYSLIEVTVAIAISLFLMAGAFLVEQRTRATFTVQNQLAQLQDNERIAMSLITDVIQSAGYYPNPHLYSGAETLVSPSFTTAGIPNIAEPAIPAIPGALGDTLTVRYAAAVADNVFDCRGDKNTAAAPFETWENTFSVVAIAGAPVGAPQFQLQCTLWSKSTNAYVTTALVMNVQSLAVLYGVNTAGPGSGSCVDTYKVLANMNPADWSNICSIKVTLTFTNPLNPKGGPQPTVSFSRVIAVMSTAGVNT